MKRRNFLIFLVIIITSFTIVKLVYFSLPITLLLGFCVIIISTFFFINTDHNKKDIFSYQIKFLPENILKILIFSLMSITLIIPKGIYLSTIIIWENVGILNYIRGFIVLIGMGYLPGACFYKILHPSDNLHQRFDIEPYILKITLYPLISFGLIGLIVLLFNQLGLTGDILAILLYMMNGALVCSDLVLQKIREKKITTSMIYIKLSRGSIFILIFALGILLISLGVFFGTGYLIIEDSWVGVQPAHYIGHPNLNPITNIIYYDSYPVFWGYIIYGLSSLSGIPYINVNAMLALYNYLFITSTYILMRTILHDFKEKFVVLSTILVSLFSGFFFNTIVSENQILSIFIFVSEFYFIYKSYSFLLMIMFIAFFIILTKGNKKINKLELEKKKMTNNFVILFLCAFFSIISFLVYLFPLFFGFLIILLYCVISGRKTLLSNLNLFSKLFLGFIFLYFILDVLISYYLSFITIRQFLKFFQINIIKQIFTIIPSNILIYSILFLGYLTLRIIILFLSSNYFHEDRKFKSKFKFNSNKIFLLFLITFTIFLTIDIISNYLEFSIYYSLLNEQSFLFLYLDKIFLILGLIGIIAIYLSYFMLKINKKLFAFLIAWIVVFFLLGSLLIFYQWIKIFPNSPNSLSAHEILYMNYWYDRVWFYAIFPLSILASVGGFKLTKKIQKHSLFRQRRYLIIFLKDTAFTIFMFMTLFGIIISGALMVNTDISPNNDEVQTIGWMSDNIEPYSKILVNDKNNNIVIGTKTMTFCEVCYIDDIFPEGYNQSEYIQQIHHLKDNDIRYFVISVEYLSQPLNSSVFIKNYLIPDFYNVTLCQFGNYNITYAPFFN